MTRERERLTAEQDPKRTPTEKRPAHFSESDGRKKGGKKDDGESGTNSSGPRARGLRD